MTPNSRANSQNGDQISRPRAVKVRSTGSNTPETNRTIDGRGPNARRLASTSAAEAKPMAIQLWNKDSTICRYAGLWGLARAIAKTAIPKTASAEPIHDREDCCPDITALSGNFVQRSRSYGLHLDPPLSYFALPATIFILNRTVVMSNSLKS